MRVLRLLASEEIVALLGDGIARLSRVPIILSPLVLLRVSAHAATVSAREPTIVVETGRRNVARQGFDGFHRLSRDGFEETPTLLGELGRLVRGHGRRLRRAVLNLIVIPVRDVIHDGRRRLRRAIGRAHGERSKLGRDVAHVSDHGFELILLSRRTSTARTESDVLTTLARMQTLGFTRVERLLTREEGVRLRRTRLSRSKSISDAR